jgi:hypothetical protein
VLISDVSHACYMHHSYHPPWSGCLYYIRWGVKIMKLLIMQFSLSSCHFILLKSKYSPQHHVLKHPQSVLLP